MDSLASIQKSLKNRPDKPPIHLWDPDFTGNIEIVIDANGEWQHEGVAFQRHSLVKLFASILRREEDGEYYLVTPVEKWRISVESTALIVTDIEVLNSSTSMQQIVFTTNVGDKVLLSESHPLIVDVNPLSGAPFPWLRLANGLTARLTRPVFYRLVDYAEESGGVLALMSDGQRFDLGEIT